MSAAQQGRVPSGTQRSKSVSMFVPLLVIGLSLMFAVGQMVSPTQIEQQAAGTTDLALTIFLHGIGKGGDNTTPGSTGATSPTRPRRDVAISIFNNNNELIKTLQGKIDYNPASGSFLGTVDAGNIPAGSYLVKIGSPQYLSKFVPGIQSITPGQTTKLQAIHLVTGDVDGDNKLTSLADFNFLMSCWAGSNYYNKFINCDDQAKKQAADIFDDGNVDQFDYNLFIRELAVQGGDEDLITPQPTQPNPTNTGNPQPTNTSVPTSPPNATPTGNTSYFGLIKSASVTSAPQGKEFTYELKVSHKQSTSLTPVNLTDKLDDKLDFVSVSIAPNGTCHGGLVNGIMTVSCGTTVSKSSTSTITIRVKPKLAAAVGSVIRNVATVRDDSFDRYLNSNTVSVTVAAAPTATVTPTPTAPLQLTKSASGSQSFPNANLSYTINVKHTTSTTPVTVDVSDRIDPKLTFLSATVTPNGSCSKPTENVICTVQVSKSTPVTIVIYVKVNATTATGTTIGNVAIGQQVGTNEFVQSNTVNVGIIPQPANPFTITKSVKLATLPVGGTQEYTITINHTSTTPVAIRIGDQLSEAHAAATVSITPSGVTSLCNKTGVIGKPGAQQITCDSIVSRDAPVKVVIRAGVTSTIASTGGIVQNTAIVSDTLKNFTKTSNTTSFTVAASPTVQPTVQPTTPPNPLDIVKIASVGERAINTPFSYSISVFNDSTTAKTVTISDTIDNRIDATSFSISRGSCSITNRVLTCTVSLVEGSPATITLQAKFNCTAQVGQAIANSATISDGTGNQRSSSVSVRVASGGICP